MRTCKLQQYKTVWRQSAPYARSAEDSRNLADSAVALPVVLGTRNVEALTAQTWITLGPRAGKPAQVSSCCTARKIHNHVAQTATVAVIACLFACLTNARTRHVVVME